MTTHPATLTSTSLDAVTDAIIDHSSLYRLTVGLATGVSSTTLSPVVEHLKLRVAAVSVPVVINASAAAAHADTLDLVVDDDTSLDAAALCKALRPGGVLALLTNGLGADTNISTESLRSIGSVPIAAGGGTLELYQTVTQPIATAGSYGVVLSSKLYNGILSANTFAFPTGKWSLLLGRSGVGKTTVLELIAGLRTSHSAKVIQTSGRTFYLPQDAEPIAGVTVDTNIALFAQSRDDVDNIATRLHLQLIRSRAVDKTLSGGERQRVVIGQALASRADVMLMDEPSAGLDQVRRTQMFHYLKRNNSTSPPTLLCVAHDFAPIVEYFDHIFEIMNATLVQHQ